MSRYPFDWVDAFTDTPFGGNGCAVVYDEGALSDEICLKFTRETGLVECTFVGPSDRADLKVRYFLAEREIPFAGHPTIATVASALDRGRVSGPDLTLETGAGVVAISVDGPQITMVQNAPEFGATISADLVAGVAGLKPKDIIAPPQIVSTGLPFCIAILRDKETLRHAQLDLAAMERFRDADTGALSVFWTTLGGVTPRGDCFSRLLLAPPNPAEDPFTGSATGAMTAFLWRHGLIDQPSLIAQQGHWMGRPGQAQVEIVGPRDNISAVKVTGQAAIVMRGEMSPL